MNLSRLRWHPESELILYESKSGHDANDAELIDTLSERAHQIAEHSSRRRIPAVPHNAGGTNAYQSTPISRRMNWLTLGTARTGRLYLPVVPRRVDRRTALKTLGSLSLLALPHPAVPLQQGETWTARFLDEAELDTVTQLAELIIPQTDTPGAKAANVHQYIDFVLSEAKVEQQGSFRGGLAWLDERSRSRFVSLDEQAQVELLAALSADGSSEDERGVAFFEQIKQLTVEGYYRSRAGMIEELDYDGNSFLGEFEGCTHPEHHDWSPEDN